MECFLEILYALAAVATVAEFILMVVKEYKQRRKATVKKKKTGEDKPNQSLYKPALPVVPKFPQEGTGFTVQSL